MKLLVLLALAGALHQTEETKFYFEVLGREHVTFKTQDGEKTIALQTIKPSPLYLSTAYPTSEERDFSSGVSSFDKSPYAVDLGMNSVPVLNQGQEGTCVTFASIAALDALYGWGDYISPQCALELYLGLGKNYWNGVHDASNVIDPLIEYGVVSGKNCDHSYPKMNVAMDPNTYKTQYADQAVPMKNVVSKHYYGLTIDMVQEILNNGHRLVMAFKIDSQLVNGFDLVIEGQKKQGGLWACQQPGSKNYCQSATTSHQVVLIGYDDSQELLKIRNSWCTNVGDDGNFYMTYQFFQIMGLDANEIYLNTSYNVTQAYVPGTGCDNSTVLIILGTVTGFTILTAGGCLFWYCRKHPLLPLEREPFEV